MSIAQRCEITKKRGRGKEHRIKRYLAWKWMADQVIYQRTISGSTYIQSLRCVMHSDTATAKNFFLPLPIRYIFIDIIKYSDPELSTWIIHLFFIRGLSFVMFPWNSWIKIDIIYTESLALTSGSFGSWRMIRTFAVDMTPPAAAWSCACYHHNNSTADVVGVF
jgi:hypothetical protein